MSVLDDVLSEELDRMKRIRDAMAIECETLPRGYISKKNIRGNVCYYLQHKENGKVLSKYISKDDIAEYQANIKRRNILKASIKSIEAEIKKIEKLQGHRNTKNEV